MTDTKLSHSDSIKQAIEESREREAKATPGPWARCEHLHTILERAGHCHLDGEVARVRSDWDMEIIAAARTYEPRFREALAVAVERMHEGGCYSECYACDTLARIEAILKGEK